MNGNQNILRHVSITPFFAFGKSFRASEWILAARSSRGKIQRENAVQTGSPATLPRARRYFHALSPCLLAAALLCFSAPAFAQQDFDSQTRAVTKRGTTAADFLGIPVGARATALGGAITATVSDPIAIYWNPAGIAAVEDVRFTGEYAEWLAGIDFNFMAMAIPARFGVVGLGLTVMRTPAMEVTTVAMQDGTGETFDAVSWAAALTYARALTDRFAIGGSVKWVQERIWNSASGGLAFDVGTQFETPFRGVRLGASISNFGSKLQITGDDLLARVDVDPNNRGNNESNRALLKTDRFDLPLVMRIGLSGEVFQRGGNRLTLSIDALNPNNSEQYLNAGAEIGLLGDLIMFRGGYSELLLENSLRSFTLGGGLRYQFAPIHFGVDYAFEQHEYFNAVNRFTLTMRF